MAEAKNSASIEVRGRKASISAFLGFFLDMFDVYLPIVVLSMAMEYFQPKTTKPEHAAIIASLVLAVTLIGRPLGSLIFGYLSDKIGRKPVTLITVSGFGVCTLLIGLLPGYATWGMTSLYLLIFLRFVDGIFLGGEYTAANVLAMEMVSKEKRGLYSGLIQAGYPVAFLAISALTWLMLQLFSTAGGLNSPYVTIGWRIPFFIGAALSLGFILPFRAHVGESDLWQKETSAAKKRENPLKVLVTGGSRFWQVFTVLSGFWFLTISAMAGFLPFALLNIIKLPPKMFTVVMMIMATLLIGGYILCGYLSQFIGRRMMIAIMGGLSCTVGIYAYYQLLKPQTELSMIILYGTIVTVVLTSVFGVTTCYLNERFPTRGRSVGFALGFSFPCILPSLYSFYQGWFANFLPKNYTILPLVFMGGMLCIIGALWGPETKDADLAHYESDDETAATTVVNVNQRELPSPEEV